MSVFPRLREITAESERESQQLQNHWSEVRYLVRCIYRQTGTPLADDQDQPLNRDKDSMKKLVDRCWFLLTLSRIYDQLLQS